MNRVLFMVLLVLAGLAGAQPVPQPVLGPWPQAKAMTNPPPGPQWLVLNADGICHSCLTVWNVEWSTNLTNWHTAYKIFAYDGFNDLHLVLPVEASGQRMFRAWRDGVGPGWNQSNGLRLATLKMWPAQRRKKKRK